MPAAILLALSLAGAPPDTTAEDVIGAMHERYAGSWPKNVTFVQTSSWIESDSIVRQETWYEAIEPGKLRIDIAPLENGNAILFRNDSVYRFQSDSLVASAYQPHPLMVLSRDVYELPPEQTMAKLERLGFDLTKVREDVWQGRPAWVVGAAAGDSTSAQFWVDRERLLFTRLIQPSRQDPSVTEEIQFNEYVPLGNGWIETEVVFLANGRRVFHEAYAEPRENVTFDDALFDPQRFGRPGWVKE
ncbi:MAG TPA: hypothetical protein VIC56_09805 [Gemmatimonadota bacterium]|jgi:hypothetical protein